MAVSVLRNTYPIPGDLLRLIAVQVAAPLLQKMLTFLFYQAVTLR